MQSRTCPEYGCHCDCVRACCEAYGRNLDHLGEYGICQKLKSRIIARLRAKEFVGPLLPCEVYISFTGNL